MMGIPSMQSGTGLFQEVHDEICMMHSTSYSSSDPIRSGGSEEKLGTCVIISQ